VTWQGSAHKRFRRALDRGNATEALSAAAELRFVGLAEALELTLLLAEGEDASYERAAPRWHALPASRTANRLAATTTGRALQPAAEPRALRRGSCSLGASGVDSVGWILLTAGLSMP
jgi:hypothetical protein